MWKGDKVKDFYIDLNGNKRRFKFEVGDVIITLKEHTNETVPYLIVFNYDGGYNFLCLICGQYDYVWDGNSKDEIKEILLSMNVIDVIKHKDFVKQFKTNKYKQNNCFPRKENLDKFRLKNSDFAKMRRNDRQNREISVSELFSIIDTEKCWNYFKERYNSDSKSYCSYDDFLIIISKFKSSKRKVNDCDNHILMYFDVEYGGCLLRSDSEHPIESYEISDVMDFKISKSTLDLFPDYVIAAELIWEYTWNGFTF